MKKLMYLLGLAVVLSGCQTTGVLKHDRIAKSALAGSTIKIGHYLQVNPDCSNVGNASVRITTQPAHGRVEFRKETAFPSFESSNIRSRCNSTRVAGLVAYYTPRAGYSGPDTFSFTVFWVDGDLWTRDVHVDVR